MAAPLLRKHSSIIQNIRQLLRFKRVPVVKDYQTSRNNIRIQSHRVCAVVEVSRWFKNGTECKRVWTRIRENVMFSLTDMRFQANIQYRRLSPHQRNVIWIAFQWPASKLGPYLFRVKASTRTHSRCQTPHSGLFPVQRPKRLPLFGSLSRCIRKCKIHANCWNELEENVRLFVIVFFDLW